MKRILSIILASILLFIMGVVGFAENDEKLSEGQMQIETELFEQEMQEAGEMISVSGETTNTQQPEQEPQLPVRSDFNIEEEGILKTLKSLGIADWTDTSYEDMKSTVSRGEAVSILMRLYGFSEEKTEVDGVIKTVLNYPDLFEKELAESPVMQQGYSIFADVPDSHVAAASIKAAYAMKMIAGTGDGNFYPDNPITYEQLAKMAVYIIGYENAAKVKGGYPYGYTYVMYDVDVYSRRIANLKENVTKLELAYILRELLEVKIYSIKSISKNSVEFDNQGNDTILTKYLELEKKEGVVNSNRFENLLGDEGDEESVVIGNERYITSGSDADSLLGCVAQYYTKEDKVILIIPDYREQIKIDVRDIQGVKNIQELSPSISYTQNNSLKNVKISDGATYIKNNNLLVAASEEDLNFDDGFVTLTDNDGDGKYDVVHITEYDIYIVDAVSQEEENIYGKDSKVLSLNEKEYIIRRGNSEVQFSEIAENDVLSVVEPSDKEKGTYEIILTRESIEGRTNARDDETVTVDETDYEVSGHIAVDSVELGKSATFLLDSMGRISHYISKQGAEGAYGWVLRARLDTQGLSRKVGIVIAAEGKKEIIYYTTDKVILNSKRMDAENILGSSDDRIKDRMLIKYTLNEEGLIDNITTPVLKDDRSVDTEKFSRDCKLTRAYNNYNYRYGEMYNMTADTLVILTVNDSFTHGDITDTQYCIVADRSQLSYNTAKYGDVEIYDADENYNIGVAVIKHNATFESGATSASTMSTYTGHLVTDVRYARDSETDEMRKQITYVSYTGTQKKAFIAEDAKTDTTWCTTKTLDKVQPGDIIAVNTNSDGEIYLAAFLFDASKLYEGNNEAAYMARSADETGGETVVHGEIFITFEKVLEKSGNTVITKAPQPTSVNIPGVPDGYKKIGTTMNANVLIFDLNEKTYKKGTANSVYKDDDVFIHVSWQWFQGIVVYR